jgi:iron only hydrogenase large subunit-like protein
MASALHELGFDDVFDTNFAADLTIIEERPRSFLGRSSAAPLTEEKARFSPHDYKLQSRLD